MNNNQESGQNHKDITYRSQQNFMAKFKRATGEINLTLPVRWEFRL